MAAFEVAGWHVFVVHLLMSPTSPASPSRPRTSRACSACNVKKLRCDGVMPCRRCAASGSACEYVPSMRGKTRKRKATTVPSRQEPIVPRPRSPEPIGTRKKEYTLWHNSSAVAQHGPRISKLWGPLPDSDSEPVQTTLPLPGDVPNPLSVLAQASENEYYAPLPRDLTTDEAPHILSLIDIHEAEALFALYHRHLHPHLPVLDLEHSSPSQVARRNNFLFNAICCVAARTFNVVLWERLKDFARYEMERIPKVRKVDVVQGHLIYATWNLIVSSSFEQDMTWLRIGLATRTALDINLHRVATIVEAQDSLPGWLLRSIVRTWLMVFVVDGTLSAQLGKPASRAREDYTQYIEILHNSPSRDDTYVAALTEWTQLLLRAIELFRTESDHLVPTLTAEFSRWRDRVELACPADAGLFQLYTNYAHLVIHSYSLDRALDRGAVVAAIEFAEYQASAARLLHCEEDLAQGCPDFVFTAITYGTVSLLKTLEPRLSKLNSVVGHETVLALSRRASEVLGRAAVTRDHLPASQSSFLSRLVQIRSQPPALDVSEPAPAFDLSAFITAESPSPASESPTNLATWAALQSANYSLPGAALGLSLGSFGDSSLFSQDSFWQNFVT